MGRGRNLNKDRDLILRQHFQKRKKNLTYSQLDDIVQDSIGEILQSIRFRKTSKGYVKAIYGGAYFKDLRRVCTKIINLIDQYEELGSSNE